MHPGPNIMTFRAVAIFECEKIGTQKSHRQQTVLEKSKEFQ